MRGHRSLIAADNIGKICGCEHCQAAGVGTERMRRVPRFGGGTEWLHAERLRDWLQGYRALRAQFGSVVKDKEL